MIGGRGQQITVEVNVSELVEKIEDNLRYHKSQFKRAHKNWTEMVTDQLRKHLDLATSGVAYHTRINFSEPVDHTHDYTELIEALGAITTETFEVDLGTLRDWQQDKWDWKNSFDVLNSTYMIQ